MASYVGESIGVRGTATDPFSGAALTGPDYSASADFWVPGGNPRTDESLRATPDVTNVAMAWDSALGAFVAYVQTDVAPWVAGKWSYRVTITGVNYTNWEYGTFSLKA